MLPAAIECHRVPSIATGLPPITAALPSIATGLPPMQMLGVERESHDIRIELSTKDDREQQRDLSTKVH